MVNTENGTSAVDIYRERSQRFAAQAERFGRHDGRWLLARGLTFVSGVCGLVMGYLDVRQPTGLDRRRNGDVGGFSRVCHSR